jgi:hypothetical protein
VFWQYGRWFSTNAPPGLENYFMCGILGFSLCRPLAPLDVELVLKHLNSLKHRGPDGEGHAVFSEQGVFIGHRRLGDTRYVRQGVTADVTQCIDPSPQRCDLQLFRDP